MDKQERQLALVAGVLIGLVVLYVFEFPWFSRTIGTGLLVGRSAAIGLIIGLIAAFSWKMTDWNWYDKLRTRMLIIVLSMVFGPLIGSLSNRLGCPADDKIEVAFLSEEYYYQSRFGDLDGSNKVPTGVYAHFLTEHNRVIRLQYQGLRYSGRTEGEQLEIPVINGRWGFQVVPVD